ncbi:MAG: hypothetical protein LBJ97_04125 [Mycoplasmataceae bacterium]|nr:hypothetical protein [Mycoplasmataceae bacterium]
MTSCAKISPPSVSFGTLNKIDHIAGLSTKLNIHFSHYYAKDFKLEIYVTDISNKNQLDKNNEIEFMDLSGNIYPIDDWVNSHPINSNYFLCPDVCIKNDVIDPNQPDANFNIHIHLSTSTVSIEKIICVIYNQDSFDFDIPIYNPADPKVRVNPDNYHKKIDPNNFTKPDAIQEYGISSMTVAGIDEFEDTSKNKSGFYVSVEENNLKDLYNSIIADVYYTFNSSYDFFSTNFWYISNLSLDENNSYCRFIYNYKTGIIEKFSMKLTITGVVIAIPMSLIVNVEFGQSSKYKLIGLFPYVGEDSTFENGVIWDIAPYDTTSYWHYNVNIANLYHWDHTSWNNGRKKIFFSTDEWLQGLYIKSWVLDDFTNLTDTNDNFIRPNMLQVGSYYSPADTITDLYLKQNVNKTFFGNLFSAPNSGSAEPEYCYPEFAFENWGSDNHHPLETTNSILGFVNPGDSPLEEPNYNWNIYLNADTLISMPFYYCTTISNEKYASEKTSAFDYHLDHSPDGMTWYLGIMQSFGWNGTDYNPKTNLSICIDPHNIHYI